MNGLKFDNRTEYRGIRFAKAERFKRPEMISYTEDQIDGTKWGNKCFQYHWSVDEFYGKEFYADPSFDAVESEDCLFLNITVPDENVCEKPEGGYPVALWFHGGAFCNGWGHEIEFSGEGYAKRGVILVTANYRLNAFGFLCHADLVKRDGISGNYGTYDQMCALDWVLKHIGMFGGDSKRVTIFGQSAGSMSVETLLASEEIAGKLSGAWMMSGLSKRIGSREIPDMKVVADVTKAYFDEKGISIDDLLSMAPEKLYAIHPEIQEALSKVGCRLGPVLDNVLLKASYKEQIEGGNFPHIHYMFSATKDDIGMKDENGNNLEYTLLDAVKETALQMSMQGNESFAYFLTRDLPGDNAGAFHSSDLWYNFGTTRRAWRPFTEEDHLLSEKMMDANARFFKGEEPFEAYTRENPFVKEWNI